VAEEIDLDVMALARRIRREENRDTLVQLLILRFGSLSREQRRRIEEADDQLLARWFEQLQSATSIDDVLAECRVG
jgi:hypothetical protein